VLDPHGNIHDVGEGLVVHGDTGMLILEAVWAQSRGQQWRPPPDMLAKFAASDRSWPAQVPQKSPANTQKSPAKEPCRHAKEPCQHAKEPC
jgi:hypothetical protein